MRLTAPIFKLKRSARDLARRDDLPLHAALDQVARTEGFNGWSHLAASHAAQPAAERLRHSLRPGEMVLLAARPGQGKTVLALDLARHSRAAHVFTLDYTQQDVSARMGQAPAVQIDTSDEICADYIIGKAGAGEPPELVVVDYLQLLDQRRSTPALQDQVAALRQFALGHGVTMVVISQVDRRFDLDPRAMPGLGDIRLPNPLDLRLFDRACFLHDGDIHLTRIS